jgi:DNA-binding NtrC family response regulator
MVSANKRILVVDDEEQVAHILSKVLRKLGDTYEIVTATNGYQALDQVRDGSFDLLITDLMMPGIDGIALTETVRTVAPKMKVIWLTAHSQWGAEAQRLGIYRYVLKPVDVDAIRQIVREELEIKALSNEPATLPTREEKRILVLDDNDYLRRLFSRVLDQAGYKTWQATTLQEARALLDKQNFDVFLCDVHLGNDRGTDLVRDQFSALRAAGTQVVMVSGEARYREVCEDMGIEFYIEKPVALDALVTLVRRLTEQNFEAKKEKIA